MNTAKALITFKGKRLDNGEEVVGEYKFYTGGHNQYRHELNGYEVDPSTVEIVGGPLVNSLLAAATAAIQNKYIDGLPTGSVEAWDMIQHAKQFAQGLSNMCDELMKETEKN